MARRRKTDGEKSSMTIRKSKRQITRKQNISSESKSNGLIDENNPVSELPVKIEDSIKMKGIKKRYFKDSKQMNYQEPEKSNSISENVNKNNDNLEENVEDNILNPQHQEIVWSDENVIEETVICEEVELDNNVLTDNVVLEEVLIDSNFGDKEVVQFTVIQNADGTESVLMDSTDQIQQNDNDSVYLVGQNVSCISTEEIQNPVVKTNELETTLLNENLIVKNDETRPITTPFKRKKGRPPKNRKSLSIPPDLMSIYVTNHETISKSSDSVDESQDKDTNITLPITREDVSRISDMNCSSDNDNNVSKGNIKHKKFLERFENDGSLTRDGNKLDLDEINSSESSNDTSVDSKILENIDKNDKKSEFRSRSGSLETNDSENSNGTVRRSSRIRSQGLMKQRSRGRGLVVKSEASKILQQDREKLDNTPSNQILKDPPDQQETQSDKENSNKIGTTEANLTLITNNLISGFNLEANKPVKVKSRWRRSSELEMGASKFHFNNSIMNCSFNNDSNSGFNLSTISENDNLNNVNSNNNLTNSMKIISKDLADNLNYLDSSIIGEKDIDSKECIISDKLYDNFDDESKDSNIDKKLSVNTSSSSSSLSSSSYLFKNENLPIANDLDQTVEEELAERLNQFEFLKENIYLTERYISKETKKMVCDCFLTDEEVERGEFGCGDDCLNRLLMIECGSRCVVNDRCTNKRFQNFSYAKCEVFKTEKKGFGLRAKTNLDTGSFIMEYVGEVIDPRDFRKRSKEYSKEKKKHYYFMALKSDQVIDATIRGNISRFINHSCDPNAETQKWTVNGELRIGFFNRRFVAAGEEITFDYHYQRFGKEAQRCYCESANCRGWIGQTPDEDNDEEEPEEKPDKREKRDREKEKTDVISSTTTNIISNSEISNEKPKKRESKKNLHIEDEDLEEEIEKLCSGGLKNRNHTLTLSRLMVRSREMEHRLRLLRLIQCGEQPCRRLFLDYHGLRLMWSYMMDVADLQTEKSLIFRLELLKTLSTLPIPNKNMLIDSKVFSVVEKWSQQESPNDLSSDFDSSNNINEENNCDNNDKVIPSLENNPEMELIKKKQNNQFTEYSKTIVELSQNLLSNWSSLKEVFKIPKKERIEQMKEHEREADRGYSEVCKREGTHENLSFDRFKFDRFKRREGFDSDRDKGERKRGRDSPDVDSFKMKDKRCDSNIVPIKKLSKYERRQLFAMKVAKEEEEKQRRQQQEFWQEHESRCLGLGMDPNTTAAVDPQTGYPLYFNSNLRQWTSFPIQEPPDVFLTSQNQSVNDTMILPSQTIPTNVYPSSNLTYPTQSFADTHIPIQNTTLVQNNLLTPEQITDNSQLITNSLSQSLEEEEREKVDGDEETKDKEIEKDKDKDKGKEEKKDNDEEAEDENKIVKMPLMDLPSKWKSAKDSRGRFYYYHVKERISQWLPPPPLHILPEESSSSESSEESSSSDEEILNEDFENEEEKINLSQDPLGLKVLEQIKVHDSRKFQVNFTPKKRRDGLVQEKIISPRREDRVGYKRHREVKEKLKKQKERARLKEHLEKSKKQRRGNKTKCSTKLSNTAIKLQAIADSNELTVERKIKDTFRINMANVIVRYLNPYRQNDCKEGRITNTEDFKFLARKLTQYVLAKELKHCKSVDELQCNENVKHKAKDFIRKYMCKFGPVYQRSSDED